MDVESERFDRLGGGIIVHLSNSASDAKGELRASSETLLHSCRQRPLSIRVPVRAVPPFPATSAQDVATSAQGPCRRYSVMPAEVVDSIRIGPTTNDLEAFGNLPLHPIGLERCAVLTIAARFGLLCGNILCDRHARADSNLCQTGLSSRSSAQNKALRL